MNQSLGLGSWEFLAVGWRGSCVLDSLVAPHAGHNNGRSDTTMQTGRKAQIRFKRGRGSRTIGFLRMRALPETTKSDYHLPLKRYSGKTWRRSWPSLRPTGALTSPLKASMRLCSKILWPNEKGVHWVVQSQPGYSPRFVSHLIRQVSLGLQVGK